MCYVQYMWLIYYLLLVLFWDVQTFITTCIHVVMLKSYVVCLDCCVILNYCNRGVAS